MRTYTSVKEAADALFAELGVMLGMSKPDAEQLMLDLFTEIASEEWFIDMFIERLNERLKN